MDSRRWQRKGARAGSAAEILAGEWRWGLSMEASERTDATRAQRQMGGVRKQAREEWQSRKECTGSGSARIRREKRSLRWETLSNVMVDNCQETAKRFGPSRRSHQSVAWWRDLDPPCSVLRGPRRECRITIEPPMEKSAHTRPMRDCKARRRLSHAS
jgi:hypothetical protein